ncbi:smc n terminal domain-containing protein, partial [Cystoisospora suis]
MDRALKEYLAARYELQKAVQKRTSIQCKKDIIAARISRGQGERPGERREEEEEDEEESSGRSSALRDVSASLSSCEMEVQREIKQAEHLGKEESDLSKHYKAQIEELEEERKKLERELETCEESQAKALKEYKETEQKQHQVAKEFEAALEELRLQQADLADLLQQQTLARTAYETACDRFWQQLRSDIREGLQAAEAFCSERGWIESSSSRCKTSDMTQQERRRSNKKGGDKEKASYPVVAGMLLDFIEVPAEYRRAVESIGAHALTSFLVPDSKAAYELLSHLKGEGEGGGGKKKPTVSITVVPLKEVGELQRRREASNRACVMRKTFLQTLLDDEDEDVHVLPLPECISVNRHGGEEDSPRLSSENEALVSAYIRSVFGRALLVPSLSEQEETGRGGASHADFSVSSLHQKGFDCVTVDGDVSFSSGIVRGGGGGFSSYLLLPSSSSSFTSNEDSHQATDSLSTLRSVQTFSKLQAYQNMEDQRHRVDQVDRQVEEKKKKVAEIEARNGALIEKEQILSEARARCQAALEEIVQTRQHAEGRLRASEELLAAIQAEKKQAEERVNGIKSLIQDLRRESLSPDKNTGLPRTEEEALISLPRQIRSLEEKVNILSKKLEESKAAVEKASAEADIHLRKQIQRLERDEARSDLLHAKEQRGELEATLASINRRMLQEEEIIRKSDRQIKLLEDEVQEKQEELQLAEKQKQSILVELEDTVRKLQAFQQAVESARRSKEEAGAVLASTGGAAAAASEGGSLQNLRMLSMKDLASRLAHLKKKLQAYEHVNRKAVDQFVNLR